MIHRALLGIVLAAFLALTARALLEHGYLGFFREALANPAIGVLSLSLVLCLSALAVWMWRDARPLGISPWPYLALGAALGAAGPLLYVVRRPQGVPLVATVTRRQLLASEVVLALTAVGVVTAGLHGHGSLAEVAGANASTQLVLADLAISFSLLAMGVARSLRGLIRIPA